MSDARLLESAKHRSPRGEGNVMSTEKYVASADVSRATAYRELTDLVDTGRLLLRKGQGRGTRYKIAAP